VRIQYASVGGFIHTGTIYSELGLHQASTPPVLADAATFKTFRVVYIQGRSSKKLTTPCGLPPDRISKMISIYMRVMRATLAVIIFALASGCTSMTTGSWEEPRTEHAAYTNVLVVALHDNDSVRDTLERQVAKSISGNTASVNTANNSSRASASTMLVTKLKDAPRDRESMLAMSREIDADALLLLQVKDSSVKLKKSKKEKNKYLFGGQIEDNTESSSKEGSWETPRTTNETDILPDTKINVEMQAVLYDVADNGRAVYTIDVKTKHKEKGGEMIYSLSRNIAEGVSNKLRREELIK